MGLRFGGLGLTSTALSAPVAQLAAAADFFTWHFNHTEFKSLNKEDPLAFLNGKEDYQGHISFPLEDHKYEHTKGIHSNFFRFKTSKVQA